jgi:hypothetical protein
MTKDAKFLVAVLLIASALFALPFVIRTAGSISGSTPSRHEAVGPIENKVRKVLADGTTKSEATR